LLAGGRRRDPHRQLLREAFRREYGAHEIMTPLRVLANARYVDAERDKPSCELRARTS
jgi:hypothetical protein